MTSSGQWRVPPFAVEGPGAPGAQPRGRVLAGGSYHILVTGWGAGFSRLGPTALTVWRGPREGDLSGFFLFLRDLESGEVMMPGQAPAGFPAPACTASASWRPGVVTLDNAWGGEAGLAARLSVCVLPDRPAELRRLEVLNRGPRRRVLDLTSCLEPCLNAPAAHAAHPVFSKLFLQTARLPGGALLARRRPRAPQERSPVLVHALVGAGAPGSPPPLQHETDRARFWGRSVPRGWPRALRGGEPLSGTLGSVLDPVLALRAGFSLEPGARRELTFLLGAVEEPAEVPALLAALRAPASVAAAFAGAERSARAELAALGLQEREAAWWQDLAGQILLGRRLGDGGAAALRRLARGGPAAAWPLPVPQTAPLVVCRAGGQVLEDLLRGHRYWRALGLDLELVVLADAGQDRLLAGTGAAVTVLRADRLADGAADLLLARAHLTVEDRLPDLEALAAPAAASATAAELLAPAAPFPGLTPPARLAPAPVAVPAPAPLLFDNGHGGFDPDGGGYVIRLPHRDGELQLPPRPWVNVIANETVGLVVSETGAACTWAGNSREHRLTPWHNDPVLDPHDERFDLSVDGRRRSVLPGPTPAPADHEVRHGAGATVFRHEADDLAVEAVVGVAAVDPVRFTSVRLTDRRAAGRPRRLVLAARCRLALGDSPEGTGRSLVIGGGPAPGSLLARNPLGGDHAGAVAFAAVAAPPGVGAPRAAGEDGFFAQEVGFDLGPGESIEIAFLLGAGRDEAEAGELIARHGTPAAAAGELAAARAAWRDRVGALQVRTPSPGLDLLVGGWLPYQTLSCRLWARTAFQQSGGAHGFRDQLQDAAGLLMLDPTILRRQLLLHAAHQFPEGDVLHWWHPPAGRGLRTRFADDLLWLPYLAAEYVAVTGDHPVLDEPTPFVTARRLEPGEDEAYLPTSFAGETASLFEHGCRALDRSLAVGFGAHGLPLFGTGDWNDGMNRVGREGRGESVWMGFFLGAVAGSWAALCEERGERERAARYRAARERLRTAIETAAWDGDWYLRGWYDDGAPLGSRASDECRIDALVQAWAVLSGLARPDRAARAMDSVRERLIDEDAGLIRLLAPPFDRTPHDPGYIKAYPPGVRENGGQYTHAALWVVRAFAELGRRDLAAPLLDMIGPVRHGGTAAGCAIYGAEPYVVAADIYGAPPHVGRGGWTWYTGSAGWMYRVAIETVLGLRLVGGSELLVAPCIPDAWPGFTVRWRVPGGGTVYSVAVENAPGARGEVAAVALDGVALPAIDGACRVPLLRDGREHRLEVRLGAMAPGGPGAPRPGAAGPSEGVRA